MITQLISAFIRLEPLIIRSNIKKSQIIREVIIQKLHISLNTYFSEDTYIDNLHITIEAVCKILDGTETDDTEKLNKAISILENDTAINDLIVDYYLAISYSYSQAKILKAYKLASIIDKEEGFYNRALKHKPEVKKLEKVDFNKKIKLIKKEKIKLQEKIKNDLREKVTNEKFASIAPIKINSTHITLLISIFSTLFLISGYYFNYQVLKSLGVNSDDFFTVQDYISTSINLILLPLSYTLIMFVLITFRVSENIYKNIESEKLGLKNEKSNNVKIFITLIILFLSNVINVISILNGGNPSNMIFYLNVSIAGILILNIIQWRYFENPLTIYMFTMTFLFYYVNINVMIDDKIENYKSVGYKSNYKVSFKDKKISTKNIEFMRVNSNYVFMINKKNNKVEIYPKLSISKIDIN